MGATAPSYRGWLVCRRRRSPQNVWCLSSLIGLRGSANVRLLGVGGRTVHSVKESDLHVVSRLAPDILEIGTNDLTKLGQEIVGSAIEDLIVYLRDILKVRMVCVCHVIPRGDSYHHSTSFNNKVRTLYKVVQALLEPLFGVFCWFHRGFTNPSRDFFLSDGVHVNKAGQYVLYRGYMGAILSALKFLSVSSAFCSNVYGH